MVTTRRTAERKAQSVNRARARKMRQEPTALEDLFWEAVRNRKLAGFKFNRQHLIDPYIVDFVCLERMLIIELDGKLHEGREAYDARRDAFLRMQGFDIYRIKNELAASDFGTLLATIVHILTTPSPQPSPPLRGGEGEDLA